MVSKQTVFYNFQQNKLGKETAKHVFHNMASSLKATDSASEQMKKLQSVPQLKGKLIKKTVYCTSSETWDLQGYIWLYNFLSDTDFRIKLLSQKRIPMHSSD